MFGQEAALRAGCLKRVREGVWLGMAQGGCEEVPFRRMEGGCDFRGGAVSSGDKSRVWLCHRVAEGVRATCQNFKKKRGCLRMPGLNSI